MEVTNELFEKYKAISPHLVKNVFHIKYNPMKDVLISAGYEGIFNAIKNYKEELEVPLYSFVKLCAHREIVREFNRQLAIREKTIPLSAFQKTYKKHYSQTEFQDRWLDYEVDNWMRMEDEEEESDKIIEKDYENFLISRAMGIISKMPEKRRDVMLMLC